MRTIIPRNAVLVPERATCVFKGQIFDTYQWQETMFDGSPATFEMLKRADSVEILVIRDNMLLVQKQEQPFFGRFFSFPGGRHDHDDESELQAAARELREETGYTCATWRLLRVTQSTQKIESFFYVFTAEDITEHVAMSLDPGERIENIWMTLGDVRELYEAREMRIGSWKLLEKLEQASEVAEIPGYEG